MRFAFLTLLLSGALVACQESGETVLGIDATGDLKGEAYLDRDGDGRRTAQVDPPYPHLRIEVIPAGGGAAVATVVSDTLGQFRVRRLAVGSYLLRPDPLTVGDSVHITRIDSALITIAANDSINSVITVGYNTPSMAQIAGMANGTRVAIFATALNAWTTFGDSSVHFADSTGAVRAVLITPTTIAAGDRVRATATVSDHAGAVALIDLTVVARTPGSLPVPIDTATAAAAGAGGRIDAAQVRIRAATVLEASSLPGGDVLFTVDDGSGPLDVLVDASAAIATALPITRGAELDVTGVLVPRNDGTGRWRLKPRFTGDVIVRYPPITIAAARTRQPGQFVMVRGVALNDVLAFSDHTVHVADGTAAIRVIVPTGLFAPGDSVSVLGEIDIGDGVQPVLTGATIAVIGGRTTPMPAAFTTVRAATADNNQRDAALVRVINAKFDTVRVNGQLRQGLNDGSGFVELVPPTFFPLPAFGTTVDLNGLLVPAGAGRWVVRPRGIADMTVH